MTTARPTPAWASQHAGVAASDGGFERQQFLKARLRVFEPAVAKEEL